MTWPDLFYRHSDVMCDLFPNVVLLSWLFSLYQLPLTDNVHKFSVKMSNLCCKREVRGTLTSWGWVEWLCCHSDLYRLIYYYIYILNQSVQD